MDSISGFNISQMFENTLQGISTKGSDLNAKMETLGEGSELSNEQMISLQFEIGQYNAMMEGMEPRLWRIKSIRYLRKCLSNIDWTTIRW